ncbi:MAG: nuclear transport factor 2 family protein [Acidobacteriaceae bacterium]|nr:nuclear transport factor 2 family protein [Acidobacteriaceae bacterium]
MLKPMPSRRALYALVALFVLFCSASAQAKRNKPPQKRDIRTIVLAIDEQWRKAEASNDLAAMDKLLSDDYLGINGNGQVLTKNQQLDRIRDHTMVLNSLQIDDVKVKVLGRHAAIVTSTAELDGTMDGHPLHGIFRSTRVYQRSLQTGQWRITNFEATPMRSGALQKLD